MKIKKASLRNLLQRAYRMGHSDAVLEMSTILGELHVSEAEEEESVDLLMEEA